MVVSSEADSRPMRSGSTKRDHFCLGLIWAGVAFVVGVVVTGASCVALAGATYMTSANHHAVWYSHLCAVLGLCTATVAVLFCIKRFGSLD